MKGKVKTIDVAELYFKVKKTFLKTSNPNNRDRLHKMNHRDL
jgi:tRNA U34 5-methylaminomethyl-2-thiouridine-forming methyltransferase MnmC